MKDWGADWSLAMNMAMQILAHTSQSRTAFRILESCFTAYRPLLDTGALTIFWGTLIAILAFLHVGAEDMADSLARYAADMSFIVLGKDHPVPRCWTAMLQLGLARVQQAAGPLVLRCIEAVACRSHSNMFWTMGTAFARSLTRAHGDDAKPGEQDSVWTQIARREDLIGPAVGNMSANACVTHAMINLTRSSLFRRCWSEANERLLNVEAMLRLPSTLHAVHAAEASVLRYLAVQRGNEGFVAPYEMALIATEESEGSSFFGASLVVSLESVFRRMGQEEDAESTRNWHEVCCNAVCQALITRANESLTPIRSVQEGNPR